MDSYLKDLYTRLDYYPKDWYEFIGVKFIPAMDGYRIINRVPMILFSDIRHGYVL